MIEKLLLASILTITITAVLSTVASPVRAGTDPADACKEAKAKTTGKKAADVLKAIGKNLKKVDPVKLSASVSKAQSKMTKGFAKAESKGGCLTTGDVGAMEAKTDAFVNDTAAVIIQGQECGNDVREGTEACDGTDDSACVGLCQINCLCPVPVCGNGILEAGEECDAPCSTGGACGGGEICGKDCACVPDQVCACGSPDPTTFEYASLPINPPATCGEIRDGADQHLVDLPCGVTSTGGGDVGIDPNQPVRIGTPTVYNVDCCYGSTVVLRGSTPGDTGSDRTCSTPGCSQGGPNPIIMAVIPTSVCSIERFENEATGWVDCQTGEARIRETIQATIYLTGDSMPDRCNGGPNPGGQCGDDTDCAPGGTCDPDPDPQSCPICNTSTNLCNGGPNDGLPCTPGTPDTGDPQYPTSYDCPTFPDDLLNGFSRSNDYADSQSETETDGQFCSFCRDVFDENTNCYEGDAGAICPDSALGPCKPQLGQTAECGTPTRCETDADCVAPYETCTQRTPGALDQPTGRTIEMTGSAAGDLTDRQQHDATMVSLGCLPPTFLSFQDNTADFPGPISISTEGPMQLKP